MSDWSVASGKSWNKSEDGFMIVESKQDCAEHIQAPKANNRVKQWLKSCTAEIANSWMKPSTSKETRFHCKFEAEDESQNASDNTNTNSNSTPKTRPYPQLLVPGIKVYSIKISELPRRANLHDPGYFSLSTHPSNWYSTVVGQGSHSNISSAIFANIERVVNNHGYHGLLEIILWANVFNIQAGEGEFWKDVEEAALRRLPKQDALVLVSGFMRSVKGRVGPRLETKYDVDAFFEGHRFCFAVKQRNGFTRMSTEEAEDFQLGRDAK
jgi:hypothetical protein